MVGVFFLFFLAETVFFLAQNDIKMMSKKYQRSKIGYVRNYIRSGGDN
jgi:hypothetical protein